MVHLQQLKLGRVHQIRELFNFSETFSPVSKGQTYRLSVSATVTTTGGSSENVSSSITRTY